MFSASDAATVYKASRYEDAVLQKQFWEKHAANPIFGGTGTWVARQWNHITRWPKVGVAYVVGTNTTPEKPDVSAVADYLKDTKVGKAMVNAAELEIESADRSASAVEKLFHGNVTGYFATQREAHHIEGQKEDNVLTQSRNSNVLTAVATSGALVAGKLAFRAMDEENTSADLAEGSELGNLVSPILSGGALSVASMML